MSATGTAATAQDVQAASAIGYESSRGGFLLPSRPNIVDFLAYLGTSVQIPTAALPPTSNFPGYALAQAITLIPSTVGISELYTLAVYSCATHILYTIAPDQPGQNYFAGARSNKGFNLIAPSGGMVASSSDESTSVSLATPDWARRLTIGQLDMAKTPWGRYALQWMQSAGPSIVGLT
jgi:hypothetical protein